MRPGPTAPRSLAGLLAAFRPCFTGPTFQTFVGLVVGLIGQTRRRTVCGMLIGAGLDQVWHHSRAHRLFTTARWSADELGLALADLIVTRLLPPGAALTIAIDDTLFKRSGKKVFGVAWHHDGAAKGPTTHRVRQLLGRGRHHRAATVSVPSGVPAGAGPAVATPAHRKDRTRPRAGRADRRPLPRPDGARRRRRRLRRGTPARPGRADHLDQPAEGHLGAARTTTAPHRALGPTAHPRCPVGHPGRPGRRRDSRGAVARHPGPPLRPHRHRADHRTGLFVVRLVSQPNRAGDSGPRRQAPDSRRRRPRLWASVGHHRSGIFRGRSGGPLCSTVGNRAGLRRRPPDHGCGRGPQSDTACRRTDGALRA